jgi:CheY-like chemotaxis protein
VKTADHPDLSKITVLVVEDDPDQVRLLFAVLEPFGARVIAARSGMEAREVLSTVTFDAVIVDLVLPGEDGLGLIRWLRAQPSGRGGSVPALAVTSFYEGFDFRTVREAGFDMFMRKPLDQMEIVHAVATLATRRRPA